MEQARRRIATGLGETSRQQESTLLRRPQFEDDHVAKAHRELGGQLSDVADSARAESGRTVHESEK